MNEFMFVFVLLCAVLLVIVAAIILPYPELSTFELERRSRKGDEEAKRELKQQSLYKDLVSLQRVAVAILLVATVMFLVASFGWLVGGILAIAVALSYGSVARISMVQSLATRLYGRCEILLAKGIDHYPGVMKVLRVALPPRGEARIDSKDELLHLVQGAGGVLSKNDQQLISNGLQFADRSIGEVMTPRSVIDHVESSETLGPLVLDDLHKKGHSRLPVIDGDLDHVVGILMVRNLLTINGSRKQPEKVSDVMGTRVYYINESQNLQHALSAFLSTKHHLFIVVNEYKETVGLLTLEDVIEALLGRKIIDEFDTHDDLRLVAERNPRANNSATDSRTV